jgi:hypothetical protein
MMQTTRWVGWEEGRRCWDARRGEGASGGAGAPSAAWWQHFSDFSGVEGNHRRPPWQGAR